MSKVWNHSEEQKPLPEDHKDCADWIKEASSQITHAAGWEAFSTRLRDAGERAAALSFPNRTQAIQNCKLSLEAARDAIEAAIEELP